MPLMPAIINCDVAGMAASGGTVSIAMRMALRDGNFMVRGFQKVKINRNY
jgi:hypothetical protein